MSCTPDPPYTLEVISGRAVSHMSMGDDWDALAVSPESLPLMTPELPAQIPDHNLLIPIDLEPLPPPIINTLDLQEMEGTGFEEAEPLPPPSMHSPDSQETEDARVQATIALSPPDIYTPDSQGTEEADIQASEFLRPPSVQTPNSRESENTDLQIAGHLPQPCLDHPTSQETEDSDIQAMGHIPPSDAYTPDSQETEDADFEAAGPLPLLEQNSQQTYIYVPDPAPLSEYPLNPQESGTDGYSEISISTGIFGSQDIESDIERLASQGPEPESNNTLELGRLGSEDTGYNPRQPVITKVMTREIRPERYPGIAFPDLPGKKLPFEKRAKLHTDEMLLELLSWACQKKTNLVIGTNNISSPWKVLELVENIGPHIVMLRLMPKHMNTLKGDITGLRQFQKKLKEISNRHKFIVISCRDISWGWKETAYIMSGDLTEEIGARNAYHWTFMDPKTESKNDSRPGFGFLLLTKKEEIVFTNLEQGENSEDTKFELMINDDKPKRPSPKQKYRHVVLDDKGHSRHVETDTQTATSYPIYTPSVDDEVDEFEDSLIAFHMKVNCLSGDGKIGYTPTRVISSGADFFIVQEEIWDADDPAKMARKYQEEGWKAYLVKTQPQSQSGGSSRRPFNSPMS